MKLTKLNLLIIAGLTLLLATPVQSQYVKTLGGGNYDEGYCVIQASDGGLIVTGATDSFGAGDLDLLLAKFDAAGNVLWTRTLGGGQLDLGYCVIEASDGGIIVAGVTENFGVAIRDAFLAKFDSTGNHVWIKTIGGSRNDYFYSIIEVYDGGFIAVGETRSYDESDCDLFLARFDSLGNEVWTKVVAGTSEDLLASVVQTSDGGIVTAGRTFTWGAGQDDLFLAKFDSTGNRLWARTLGGTDRDGATHIIEASDGALVASGWTRSYGSGQEDFLFAKYDSSGNLLWARTLGGTNIDIGRFVMEASDGGFVVIGGTASFGAGNSDLLLAKFDGVGNHLWTKTLGGAESDVGRSVIQVSGGGLVAVGGAQSFGVGGGDLLLAAFDPSGNTCLGEFVTAEIDTISPDTAAHTLIITSPLPTIISPSPTVTSPTPAMSIVCDDRAPTILSVTDVGNDQGKQARTEWHRCYFDSMGSPLTITEYSLWRRIDQYLATDSNDNPYGRTSYPPGDWDFVKTVPARGETTYNTICPTLADSTETEGMYWSVFFVSAMTPDPLVYFDSESDSGYSLDNIPPMPIVNLELVGKDSTHLYLDWTVPGEYPGEEAIFGYDVRYNTMPLVGDPVAWWDNATPSSGQEFFTCSRGGTDSLKSTFGPIGLTPYYFAIKAKDLRPNFSLISNVTDKFMCGDVDNDTTVGLADAVYLINYVLKSGPAPKPYVFVGDVTPPEAVDIVDVVYLINYLFRNGPPPCTP